MRRHFIPFSYIVLAMLVAGCVRPILIPAQQRDQQTAAQRDSLRTFLRDYVRDPRYDYEATRYFAAFVDLRDEGPQQVIVYFTDRYSCGSGGCTTLILTPESSSYKVVTSITIARLPIRVLNTKFNGWHDIGVWVEGGGIQPGYEALLSFDGITYPRNPSVLPARRLERKVPGEVVVPRGTEGTPLFPER